MTSKNSPGMTFAVNELSRMASALATIRGLALEAQLDPETAIKIAEIGLGQKNLEAMAASARAGREED
jgi:3-deoxy-D-manno-octulosonic acid (KDO) 8-phosphate synthase